MTAADVRAFGAGTVLGPPLKGYPLARPPTALADVGERGWSAVDPSMSFPLAVLRRSALASNLETMRRFCRAADVDLAPHAKTTMAPGLIADQLDAGARALTAANPRQVLQLWDFGVRRVVLANEVADPADLGLLARRLADDGTRELILFVDSAEGVRLADRAMAAAGGSRRLPVLVDLGHPAGRTGVRDLEAALALAGAVRGATHLRLAGVGGFEGTIGTDRSVETLRRVDAYLAFALDVARALLAGTREEMRENVRDDVRDGDVRDGDVRDDDVRDGGFVVSFGGSAYFDRVVEVLAPVRGPGVRIVLRSGCYVVHDHGLYERSGPTGADGWRLPPFRPALEVWTRVISRPEPGLALLNAGKRDLSFDAGLPVVVDGRSAAGGALPVGGSPGGLVVSALSDQHAFLPVPDDHPLAVGDLVALGVSHPCTTFDRWPLIYLVDDDHRITGAVRTYV
jgi:D-serine dehydratase